MRPEARAALERWREVMFTGALLGLGLWFALTSYGALKWLGWVLAVIGAVLVVAAVQRLRFRMGKGGAGFVQVDEGQIGYFGPVTGGIVARSEMSRVVLDPTMTPPHWKLSQPGQADLLIPLTAHGAEALFDAFAALPGIKTERMLAQMRSEAEAPVTIWQKRTLTLH